MLRGTLERVPRTPQNFSQILYWRGWGGGAERGLAPGGGCAPARHLFALPLWCPVGGLPRAALAIPAPGERTISNAEVPLPRSPPLLGCRHCSPVPRPNRNAPAGCRQRPPSRQRRGVRPSLGTCLAGVISAAWVQARGCKGRSPLHKKTKNLPLPHRGRGAGG